MLMILSIFSTWFSSRLLTSSLSVYYTNFRSSSSVYSTNLSLSTSSWLTRFVKLPSNIDFISISTGMSSIFKFFRNYLNNIFLTCWNLQRKPESNVSSHCSPISFIDSGNCCYQLLICFHWASVAYGISFLSTGHAAQTACNSS